MPVDRSVTMEHVSDFNLPGTDGAMQGHDNLPGPNSVLAMLLCNHGRIAHACG